MHFPKYWAKGHWEGRAADGTPLTGVAWGWSDESKGDAESLGRERAQRVALARAAQQGDQEQARYPYASTPLRELTQKKIGKNAIISRNAYGCEVLNTTNTVFVDVDRPHGGPNLGFFAALFGRRGDGALAEFERSKIELLSQFQRAHPDLAFRVYRTAGGLRYLLTSRTLTPDDHLVEDLFRSVDCDPNYKNLCKLQESFRARLTPKPWRVNSIAPPYRFPFETSDELSAMESWVTQYRERCAGFATCQFLESVGNARTPSEIEAVIREHDAATRATSELPLA